MTTAVTTAVTTATPPATTTTTPAIGSASPEDFQYAVGLLFAVSKETGAYVKAKGLNGFFLTVAGCPDERVRRAWLLSCGGDDERIRQICGDEKLKHGTLPDDLLRPWGDALVAVFGASKEVNLWNKFTAGKGDWSDTKPFKKRSQTSKGMSDIKSLHVYKLVRKP